MNEAQASVILNYMDENLFEPRLSWPKTEFSKRTYSRWAANEILCLIMENPFHSVTDIIDGFIFKMLYFSYMVKDEENGSKFLIAIEVAEDILFLCRR